MSIESIKTHYTKFITLLEAERTQWEIEGDEKIKVEEAKLRALDKRLKAELQNLRQYLVNAQTQGEYGPAKSLRSVNRALVEFDRVIYGEE